MRLGTTVAVLLMAAGPAATGRAGLPIVVAADVPMYPREAIDARTSATVRLSVSTDGQKAASVRVTGTLSPLTTSALDNIKTWRFASHEPASFDVTYRYAILTRGCEVPGRDTHAAATLQFPTSVDVFAEVDGECPSNKPPPPKFGIYITRAPVPFYPAAARQHGVEGDVTVTVSQKGELTIAEGPDELAAPVVAAIRTWQFSPPPFPEPVRFTFKLVDGDCTSGGPVVSVGPQLTSFEVTAKRGGC
jgi:hypothetical protein